MFASFSKNNKKTFSIKSMHTSIQQPYISTATLSFSDIDTYVGLLYGSG